MDVYKFSLASMLLSHFYIVWSLFKKNNRMGKLNNDQPKDRLYKPVAIFVFYSCIFLAQGFALLIEVSDDLYIRRNLIYLGLLVYLVGYYIRMKAVKELGHFFSMQIGLREKHRLIQSGLYRFVRHPSYTGYIFMILGYGIAAQVWVSFIVPLIFVFVFLTFRIKEEEEMLLKHFSEEYLNYQRRTNKILPFNLFWRKLCSVFCFQ